MPFFRKKFDDEEKIIKDVDFVLKKETDLRKIETMLKKDVEEIYNRAIQLDSKEQILKEREKKISDSEKQLLNSGNDMPSMEKMKSLFILLDDLLEKLPEIEIEKFTQSNEFETYKKVMGSIRKNGTNR